MSIHEQITALLDGELVDAGAVDELLHVLAVSPEKRELLVDQLALKRRYASSAAAVVPPVAADLAIMRGLGAVDASIVASSGGGMSTMPSPVAHVAAPTMWRRVAAAAIVLLLLAGAYGIGYWTRGDATTIMIENAGGVKTGTTTLSPVLLSQARDSIAMLSAQLASVNARASAASMSRTEVRRVPRSAASVTHGGDFELSVPKPASSAIADVASQLSRVEARAPGAVRNVAIADAAARSSSLLTPRFVERPEVAAPVAAASPVGAQIGMRTNFRLSLPRVYGLSPSATVLSDREIIGSYELGNDDGRLLSRIRAGVAFGQTQFGQVFHTNTGGAPVDTIFEQSPQVLYGRMYIAPELVRFEQATGMLEVGGGYSGAGGFGSVGLNVEYRPIEQLALHGGASTWLLWSSYREVVNLSTNLNLHLGFMFGF